MAVVEAGEQAAFSWGEVPRDEAGDGHQALPVVAFSSCGSCKRSSVWKFGFTRCSLMKTYECMPEAAKCYFSPSKYDPRK